MTYLYKTSGTDFSSNIELSKKIIKCFKERRMYLENNDFSYKNVLGEDYECSPWETNQQRYDFPYRNKNKTSGKKRDDLIKRTIKEFLKKTHDLSVSIKDINIENKSIFVYNSSKPIKIEYSIDGKKQKKAIFIKKPNILRVLGKTIYPLVSGYESSLFDNKKFPFLLNQKGIIEEELSGKVLYSIGSKKEEQFLNENSSTSLKYIEGIIRANVHNSFMGLYCDVIFPANRIVDKLETILFDFNMFLFSDSLKESKYFLIGHSQNELRNDLIDKITRDDVQNALLFHYKHIFQKGKYNPLFENELAKKIEIDEKIKIYNRIKENKEKFFKIIQMLGKVKQEIEIDEGYFMGKDIIKKELTMDELVKKHYNHSDLIEFFKIELEEYKKLCNKSK